MTDETKPAKLGRPTKLTPELSKAICDKVAEGLPLHVAAGLQGINYSTIRRWTEDAEKEDATDLQKDFCADLARARSLAEADLLNEIKRKSDHSDRSVNPADWKADLAILKVMNPKAYNDKQTVAVTNAEGGNLLEGLAGLLANGHQDT